MNFPSDCLFVSSPLRQFPTLIFFFLIPPKGAEGVSCIDEQYVLWPTRDNTTIFLRAFGPPSIQWHHNIHFFNRWQCNDIFWAGLWPAINTMAPQFSFFQLMAMQWQFFLWAFGPPSIQYHHNIHFFNQWQCNGTTILFFQPTAMYWQFFAGQHNFHARCSSVQGPGSSAQYPVLSAQCPVPSASLAL